MRKLFIATFILFFTLPVLADESVELKPKGNKRRVLRHERRREKSRFNPYQLELVKPYTTYDFQVEPSGGADPLSNNSHAEWGIRFTYAGRKKNKFGYFLSASYLEYGGSNSNSLRLEGGGSYTFSKHLFSLAGIHVHKFLNADTAQIIDLGIGANALLGMQITQEFGIKVGYTYTKFLEKEYLGRKINITLLSPEIGLYWSF